MFYNLFSARKMILIAYGHLLAPIMAITVPGIINLIDGPVGMKSSY